MGPFQFSLLTPPRRTVEAPPFVAHNEPSRQAVVAIRPVAGTLRARVLAAIEAAGERGLTDEEGCEQGMNPSTWRPRRVELEAAGLIRKVAERPGRSGRMMAVFSATGGGGGARAAGT